MTTLLSRIFGAWNFQFKFLQLRFQWNVKVCTASTTVIPAAAKETRPLGLEKGQNMKRVGKNESQCRRRLYDSALSVMGRLIMKAARAKSGNCILSDCGFLVTAAALSEAAFVKEIEREINIVDISSAAATDAFSCVFATKKAKSDQRVSVGKWRIPIETILPPARRQCTHPHPLLALQPPLSGASFSCVHNWRSYTPPQGKLGVSKPLLFRLGQIWQQTTFSI